jgi:TnpA family transposase
MPVQFLTKEERQRWDNFPGEISNQDADIYFTLSQTDKEQIPQTSQEHNRLGFVLQLCALRYLGFYPTNLASVPDGILRMLAAQIQSDIESFDLYGQRLQTVNDHRRQIEAYLGFFRPTILTLDKLGKWLFERALEHDKPTLLFQLACEKLHQEKVARPGISVIERMVATARREARERIYETLQPIIEEHKAFLDQVLIYDKAQGKTMLNWLSKGAVSSSPKAILETLKKLNILKQGGVTNWNLQQINPNLRKFLAQLAGRSTNQALLRTSEDRRYPALIAFLHRALEQINDELIDLFDRYLSTKYSRSKNQLDEFRKTVARATNEKVLFFQKIATILLDPAVTDEDLRSMVYTRISEDNLRRAVVECDRLMRPQDDNFLDFFTGSYSDARKFIPNFLTTIAFHATNKDDSLLQAVNLIRKLSIEGKRKVPEDAPTEFVSPKWQPYVWEKDGQINRRYYEMCVLWELKNALRAGDIWLENSCRYAAPESYLIPPTRWAGLRQDVFRMLRMEGGFEKRFFQRTNELNALLAQTDKAFLENKVDGQLRMEKDKLVVARLRAEELSESSRRLSALINERLPLVDLPDLLIEVDSWTEFTRPIEHAGNSSPCPQEDLPYLYAALLSHACNFGPTRMAQAAKLSRQKITWYTNWYLREETLRAAIIRLVNFHYQQPLTNYWGGGTLSSSDGQRFPVPVKSRVATALPKYFGYGRGLTFYSWTSDQFSQYGSRVIPATMRDATYVLDAILDNETDLTILEHTTDTSGYTELIFALFDLLGMQFSPRLRDIGSHTLYRIDADNHYAIIGPLLQARIRENVILKQADQLLRVAGSLKLGWVTASLLINKFQSHRRQGALLKALQEYGRLNKTIFILRYILDETYQRRIGKQLNKGEALHDLRAFLMFAREGQIRLRQLEDQENQASCLTLITNAVIAWNTVYMGEVVEKLKSEGVEITDQDIAHLSPCRYEHINKYGNYEFNIEEMHSQSKLRPLRQP